MMGLLWTSFEEYLRNHGQSYATDGIEQLIFQIFQALKEKDANRGHQMKKEVKVELAKIQQMRDFFTEKNISSSQILDHVQ